MNNNNVAAEILTQLGGNKFIAMTGSKNLVSSEDALTMHLAKNNSKAKYLRIEINQDDTYNMVFRGPMTREYTFPVVTSFDHVYADMLQELFTCVTGLDTRL